MLSLQCFSRAGALLLLLEWHIKRPPVSAWVPVWLAPWLPQVGWRLDADDGGGNVSAPAVTLSEYTQPILTQTLNPTHPVEPYSIAGPLIACELRCVVQTVSWKQSLPRQGALTIQSIVTHQWNKDSFMVAHNVRMAAGKGSGSAEHKLSNQEASEVLQISRHFPQEAAAVESSRELVLAGIRK